MSKKRRSDEADVTTEEKSEAPQDRCNTPTDGSNEGTAEIDMNCVICQEVVNEGKILCECCTMPFHVTCKSVNVVTDEDQM